MPRCPRTQPTTMRLPTRGASDALIMTTFWTICFDLACLLVLVGLLYHRRHGRSGVALLLVTLNVGALAVVVSLDRSAVSAGLGLGLFGALSIIRLRSEELSVHDVAYVFAALAMGLLGGFVLDPVWVSPALTAMVLAAVAIVDHPRVIAVTARTQIRLDGAHTGDALVERVERLLGHPVLDVEPVRLDLVDDSTTVRVTYRRDARESGEDRGTTIE